MKIWSNNEYKSEQNKPYVPQWAKSRFHSAKVRARRQKSQVFLLPDAASNVVLCVDLKESKNVYNCDLSWVWMVRRLSWFDNPNGRTESSPMSNSLCNLQTFHMYFLDPKPSIIRTHFSSYRKLWVKIMDSASAWHHCIQICHAMSRLHLDGIHHPQPYPENHVATHRRHRSTVSATTRFGFGKT